MEDNTLSITASITGILTFIAAILAFIYVRYTALQNGYTEIFPILRSVEASLEDTQTIKTTVLDDILRKLLTELYQLKIEIIAEVAAIRGRPRPVSRPSETTRWSEVQQAVQQT